MDKKIKERIQNEASEYAAIMDNMGLPERAKKIWNFAKKRLMDGVVVAADGSEHSAVMYATQLYMVGNEIGQEGDEAQESYQILGILMALAAIRTDHWGYSAKLNYDLRAAGIRLRRDERFNEVLALAAQKGDWTTNRDKGKCMEGNLLATAMYCADIAVRCGTLVGSAPLTSSEIDPVLKGYIDKHLNAETPQACVEGLLRQFLPEYLGGANGSQLTEQLIGWLASTDFYVAPASTKYHGAYPGGLVQHKINVFCRLVMLEKPITGAHVGKLILAAIGHDLCKTGFYKPTWKNEKVYCADGDKQDNGGRFKWVSKQGYEIEDTLPIGHGEKSMYMLNGVLDGKLPEEVAGAIVGHMNDHTENPEVDLLYVENPFARTLALADILASQYDEAESR